MSRKFSTAVVKLAKYSSKLAEHGDTVALEAVPAHNKKQTAQEDKLRLRNAIEGKNNKASPRSDSHIRAELARAKRQQNPHPKVAHEPSHASKGIYKKRKGQ